MSDSEQRITDAVVDHEALGAALREQEEQESDDGEIIRAEPFLSNFVQGELLKVYGKLGLAGAPPGLLHGLATDLNRLLGVTAGAVRMGYRALLSDFIPESFGSAKGKSLSPQPPDQQDGNGAGADGGETGKPF